MGRRLTDELLVQHKNDAIKKLDGYIQTLIDSDTYRTKSKADKLSYWIEDWCTFLDFEPKFQSKSLRRYKRGEVVKAHLGYNVGSEEGGLRYCLVLDKKNSINSPVITVVPLTSCKEHTDIEHLHPGNVFLGNELYTSLQSKITSTRKILSDRITHLHEMVDNFDSLDDSSRISFERDLLQGVHEESMIANMNHEIRKMRLGSIALVSQVTTISKIRIYDPKTNYDILSNVKLSNEKLNLIDNEFVRQYIKQ